MSKINTGYSLNECPPMKETIIYSIQQIIVAVFNVIPVPLLIGAGIGLRSSDNNTCCRMLTCNRNCYISSDHRYRTCWSKTANCSGM